MGGGVDEVSEKGLLNSSIDVGVCVRNLPMSLGVLLPWRANYTS